MVRPAARGGVTCDSPEPGYQPIEGVAGRHVQEPGLGYGTGPDSLSWGLYCALLASSMARQRAKRYVIRISKVYPPMLQDARLAVGAARKRRAGTLLGIYSGIYPSWPLPCLPLASLLVIGVLCLSSAPLGRVSLFLFPFTGLDGLRSELDFTDDACCCHFTTELLDASIEQGRPRHLDTAAVLDSFPVLWV